MSGNNVPRPHGFTGWPDRPCAAPSRSQARRRCERPRSDPLHLRYPCGICTQELWSIDARLRHRDEHHPLTQKVWETAT